MCDSPVPTIALTGDTSPLPQRLTVRYYVNRRSKSTTTHPASYPNSHNPASHALTPIPNPPHRPAKTVNIAPKTAPAASKTALSATICTCYPLP